METKTIIYIVATALFLRVIIKVTSKRCKECKVRDLNIRKFLSSFFYFYRIFYFVKRKHLSYENISKTRKRYKKAILGLSQ
jgi:hypothetical protein